MHVIWLDVSMFECPMGARVVVVGVAGRGELSWSAACCWHRRPWDGQKQIVEKKQNTKIQIQNILVTQAQELDSALWIAALDRSL